MTQSPIPSEIIRALGWEVYSAVNDAGHVERRTKVLKIRRETYPHEYANAAREAVTTFLENWIASMADRLPPPPEHEE